MKVSIRNNQLVNGQIPEALLHEGITDLDLWNCSLLTQLPNLPAGITRLNLFGCKSLTHLPALPAGIVDLNLFGCKSLTQLPDLPAGITDLDLWNCRSLTELPNLPAGIVNLSLYGCRSLTQLPENLPDEITRLNLDGCTNLHPTPELLRQLDEIERTHHDAEVKRPQHWPSKEIWINEAKERLDVAIENSGIEPRPRAITDLLHRFTSEGLYARSLPEIMNGVAPVIDLIETNPSYHLKWIEEIALDKIDGCVNQPVQNWLEISGFTAMYQENLLLDKIEASKQILAREEIITFINSILPPSARPGDGVEVEFANALIREVHKMLEDKKIIEKPWLGIPGKIAYEGTIERHLTQETIIKAYDYIMEKVVSRSPLELTKLVLEKEDDPNQPMKPYEHLRSSWMKAIIKGNKTLETKSREIDGKYEREKASLMQRINEEENPKEQERLGAQYDSIDSRKEQERIDLIKTVVIAENLVDKVIRGALPSPSIRGVVADAVEHVASGKDGRESPQAGYGPPLRF